MTIVTNKSGIEFGIDALATDVNGKADRDGSNMVDSVKKFDGEWIFTEGLQFANTVTWQTGTTDKTYSLSSYLPNDGYDYELFLTVSAKSGSTSGDFMLVRVSTDAMNDGDALIPICMAMTRTASTMSSQGSAIVIVGQGRYVKVIGHDSNNANGTYSMWAGGYRRIGTNS